MDANSDPLRHLILRVDASHPKFLEGIDIWLRLGLVSEVQVKQLSQRYLSCPLPEPVAVSFLKPVAVLDSLAPATTPPASQTTPLFSRAWQAFKDELSVRWLLFLGLFLVVVSSGVLAATQWQRFPVIGQYAVL